MTTGPTPSEFERAGVAFRSAVAKLTPFEQRFASLRGFPTGCCRDASFLLARMLDRCFGFTAIEYVWGSRGAEADWHTHGWLEIDGWIVDVTADQFPEVSLPVIVARPDSSQFHTSFQCQKRTPYPDFWSFHEEAASDFDLALRRIFQVLSE
jgi:hypothetical protein